MARDVVYELNHIVILVRYCLTKGRTEVGQPWQKQNLWQGGSSCYPVIVLEISGFFPCGQKPPVIHA